MDTKVTKGNLQEFATKLHNKYKSLFASKDIENTVAEIRSAVGSPLVASTVAEMTDTEKVYVYVGSETGYTAGNWYYYDGAAWTSGGVYNSTAFETDDTLSIAGMAADAKATGNEISNLNNALGELADGKELIDFTVIPNEYPTLNGFSPYLNWDRSEYIPVNAGETIYINNPHLTSDNVWYNASKEPQSKFSIAVGSPVSVTVPSGISYMVISNGSSTFFGTVYRKPLGLVTEDELNQWTSTMSTTKNATNNADKKAIENVGSALSDGGMNVGNMAFKRGSVNLVTGEYDSSSNNLAHYMVHWMFEPIKLELDSVIAHVKSGYKIRGVLLKPDKTYDSYFALTWSQGGTISELQNKKGYYAIVVVSRSDDAELSDEEVETAGLDTFWFEMALQTSEKPFDGKKVVNFGDSIFGNFRDTNETTDKSISKMLQEALGGTFYNAGFGGCRMGYHSDGWRAFSMYSLADAITTGVWTEQDSAIANPPTGLPNYFSDTLTMLKSLDFSEIDYITIGYGVNDYTGNAYIDYRSGLQEYQYFKGALEYSLRTILETYPQIRILVITPCWMWFPDESTGLLDYSSDDNVSANTRGLKLTDYVQACKTVCDNLHNPCVDTYTELGFNQYSYKAYFNVKGIDGVAVSDGTHPKQLGRQLRADRIAGQMIALFCH